MENKKMGTGTKIFLLAGACMVFLFGSCIVGVAILAKKGNAQASSTATNPAPQPSTAIDGPAEARPLMKLYKIMYGVENGPLLTKNGCEEAGGSWEKLKRGTFCSPASFGKAEDGKDNNFLVPVGKLMGEYEANEVKADNLYKGRLVSLSGQVHEIRKDFTGGVVISTVPRGNKEFVVNTTMVYPSGQSDVVAMLSKGDVINFFGKVDGFLIGNVVIRDVKLTGVYSGGKWTYDVTEESSAVDNAKTEKLR
jgi:hypothetical protein